MKMKYNIIYTLRNSYGLWSQNHYCLADVTEDMLVATIKSLREDIGARIIKIVPACAEWFWYVDDEIEEAKEKTK